MGFEFVCGLRPQPVHFEHFAAPATFFASCGRRYVRQNGHFGTESSSQFVVNEVDRRLRRIIEFAHTAVALEVGIAHETM